MKLKKNIAGDTIVEVFIAIAVAAFAIGTSYAIANKSLQRAISARERNEAISIIQNQITTLKTRYKNDPYFLSRFAVTAGQPAGIYDHFCLDDSATNPSQSNWLKFSNDFTTDAVVSETRAGTLATKPTGYYDPKCRIAGSSTNFFVDITAMVTSKSVNALHPTVYKVKIRWSQPGEDKTASAEVFYRVGSTISSNARREENVLLSIAGRISWT